MWTAVLHFVAVSTIVHISCLYCVYDSVHYSVVGRGMPPQIHKLKPPADRVVLYAVKGLQLNHSYEVRNSTQSSYMPFIRTVIRRQGRWGVSHSKLCNKEQLHTSSCCMPYLTGVTQQDCYRNHDCHDSLLDASSTAWVWSCDAPSNDLAALASKRIESKVPPHKMCSVNRTANCSMYNSWVFSSIGDLLLIHSNEREVANKLNHSKSVFLFNLDVSTCLETDSDLAAVDQIFNYTTDVINAYFADNRTAFLMFGVPPDSGQCPPDPQIGLYPFVAWGAGIKKPRSSQYGDYRYDDGLGVNWNLEKFERIDLQMVDIAPFVAALLGIRIPVHSQGVVPHGYIHYNKEFIAEALFSNVKQFMEKVHVIEQEIKSQSSSIFFRPYKGLTLSDRAAVVRRMERLIEQRKLQEVVDESRQIIHVCEEALLYYSTYHHLSLRPSLLLTLVGWIVYIISQLLKEGNGETSTKVPSIPCFISCLAVVVFQYYQNVSCWYYIYHSLPLLCWDLAIRDSKHIFRRVRKELLRSSNQFVVHMVVLSVVFLGIQMIFLGLVHHCVWLMLILVAIGGVAPFVALRGSNSLRFGITWLCLCVLLSCCLLLPHSSTTLVAMVTPVPSILLLISVHSYLMCNPFLRYKLTNPRSRLCSLIDTLSIDTFVCVLAGLVAIAGAVCKVTVNEFPQFLTVVGQLAISITVLMLVVAPRSIPGRLLHISTLSVIFNVVDGSSNVFYLILLLLVLFFTLYMADTTPNQSECVSGMLLNGMFGCLYFSEFPPLRNSPGKPAKLASINDIFRAGFMLILLLVSVITIVPNTDAVINTENLLFSLTNPSVVGLVSLIIKLIFPILCIYCAFNVISVKMNFMFLDFVGSALIVMDVLILQLFLTNGFMNAFVTVVFNALLCPLFLCLARTVTGSSIIPRKAHGDSN